ncbi:hypothetical protein C0991_006063 [Blastosporella zonata]|nr:hypothetical protein C0991_006063 [Blastosporella zonata]
MKKTTTSFTAQLVTYETTLAFQEVIARLDAEINKAEAGAGQFIQRLRNVSTKKDLQDLVSGVTGDHDFVYFLEMNHYIWMNVYHEAETTPPAVVYTIGNPILAETFMRYDIRAGYSIPPRLMIVQNADASLTTVFYHLPSSLVVSDNEELNLAIRVVDDKLEKMITRVTADTVSAM